ncbi:hypothetical protein ACIBG8_38395 [Nonomuraea sp. NPDC050556]|uniref:hypothetical protein n=1 Tax=Nonomuraea sp. NPDC050556 TaxID=3364369 RepID=UPI00379AE46F
MVSRLFGILTLILAATTLVAVSPASASTSSAPSIEVSAVDAAGKPRLLKGKPYFGRCKNTCHVYVKLRNVSGQSVFQVNLKVSLKINGRNVGTCRDYVGTIRAHRRATASCVVRSGKLSRMWSNRYDYGRWYAYAWSTVRYLYYR